MNAYFLVENSKRCICSDKDGKKPAQAPPPQLPPGGKGLLERLRDHISDDCDDQKDFIETRLKAMTVSTL